MGRMIFAAAAMALLAGCGDSGGADADGDGNITAQEAAAEAASGGQVAMRPGRWEQKMELTEIDMPGMPAGMADMIKGQMGQGMTVTHCLTEEDVQEPTPEMFSGEGQDNCKFEEFDRSGNNMRMRMSCDSEGGGKVNIAMDGEYGAEAYRLDMDMNSTGGAQGDMNMKGAITARRIGDCG